MNDQKNKSRLSRFFKILGPGLITGAADDDPSGIATYSQTGAQFGYGQLWSAIFLYPLMTAVQEACARIGAVTKKGIAALIKDRYGNKVLYIAVALVLFANTINIGADIGAMAASLRLLVPIDFTIATLGFVILILALEIFVSYKTYARFLKWLVLVVIVYPITLFIVREPWGEIFHATFTPHIQFTFEYLFILTGVVGTTISPYMFFWQASEEVEEAVAKKEETRKGISPIALRNLRIDNALGMFVSQAVTWCIIVVAGTVLNKGGIKNITTAADAAHALVPLVQTFPNAGFLAGLLFAIGIIGLGLLAVPVLAGSAAYAVAEAFNWREGLYRKLRRAHGFYGVITIATLVGLVVNFIGIDPMKALVVAAVVNGVVAVPLIAIIALLAGNRSLMGEAAIGAISKTLLWITFALMLISALGLFLPR